MITHEEFRLRVDNCFVETEMSKETKLYLFKYSIQQEKVNELLKEHMQLSYDFEYMLVHGIKDDIKYTKTANRLLTVREKLQEILNWKSESELNDKN